MPRISGMHWVMSFVGCIGFLMKNSGLISWLKSAFGGAEKTLSGQKINMNIRTPLFAMLELLRDYIGKMKSEKTLRSEK